MNLYDSFTLQTNADTNLSCEQEDRGQKSSSPKLLDETSEVDRAQKISSSKALEETSEVDRVHKSSSPKA